MTRRRWYDPLGGAPGEVAGRRRRGSHGPRPVADVLDVLQSSGQWRARLDGARIHDVWEQVAGPAVAGHVRPVRLLGGVLVVEVSSASWATQVRYLEQELVDRANTVLGAALVTHVRVTVAAR